MTGEQQHYVPRFLLKNFAHGQKPKIFVYDKSNDRQFHTNIRNVAAERGFYDLDVQGATLTMEPGLADLEATASKAVRRLIQQQNLKAMEKHEIMVLAVFMAVQFVRTKELRLRFEQLVSSFTQKLRDMGISEKEIQDSMGTEASVAEDKVFGLSFLQEAKAFVPHFLNKAWLLLRNTTNNPLFISDNPIVLHNELNHRPYGNLGVAVRGIEIYFPVSSTLCLNLLCPTTAREFMTTYESLTMTDPAASGSGDRTMRELAMAKAFYMGLTSGVPIQLTEDNVTMINSLQVTYSSRFVYCKRRAFELVQRMITDNPKYRQGHKIEVL